MRRLIAAPAWLVIAADRTQAFEDPEKTVVVQRIFKEAAEGLGAYAIVARLRAEGVPTIGRSKMWQASSVDNILKNRAVIGEFQPVHMVGTRRVSQGEPVLGIYPAIVSPELFETVQAIRRPESPHRKGRKGTSFTNLFGSTLHCSRCRQRMKTLKENGINFVICSSFASDGICISRKWPYQKLERILTDFVTTAPSSELADLRRLTEQFAQDPYAKRYAFSLKLAEFSPTIFLRQSDDQASDADASSSGPRESLNSLVFASTPPWAVLFD